MTGVRAGRAQASGTEVDGGRREGVRMILLSTRFIASIFWLTIIVAAMLFVLPYSERSESPVFYGFVALSVLVFLGHRYFPYEGYRPVAFFTLMLATDALIAVMVYMAGGIDSGLSLLFLTVIIFSSAYFELLETMLITAVTCLVYFAPIFYETVSMESLKSMAIAVPIYVIIALGGTFVINKAREQEREKQAVANLLDKADSKRRELSTLYALSLKLASTLDEDEITAMLIDSASALVHNEAIAVSLLEPDGRLSPRAIQGLDEEGMTALVAEGDENPLYLSVSAVLPVVLGEAGEDPRFRDFLQETGFSSMIAVPLFASSSVVGELCCFSREEAAFDDDAAKLLLTLASEVALALEKASLYRRTLQDKSKIETIINSISDGLLVIDQEGRLVLANPFVARLLGLRATDYGEYLPGLLQASRCGIESREVDLADALERVLKKGESVKSELLVKMDPDIIFKMFWTPLPDVEGSVGGAVILLHDITDFVELDRMKSDFISIVSHELKTPLTSIKGFVGLLAAERVGPITEKQRHYLDVVQKQTESLTLLINDLLDLSRIEAGMIDVRHEPVALAEVIGGVVQQLDNLAQEKDIAIKVDIPRDLPALDGDGERLAQVFMNIIHNAIKFTPEGGTVSLRAAAAGDNCVIRISDTGIGIAAQDLPRIFDKFYQVDSSSTRQQSGTGLGLSICKQLVSAHAGEMWANSAKGRGTTFTIILPLRAAGAAPREGKTAGVGEVAAG
ncbi:MAG: ATP-binding protein [Actinomycetota bacterium]|nr:ATP-binding protein [Actinomycetota bacterium]MDD5665840.1 ATP-binding protein [Actinomycetota bacterium]